MDTKNDVREKTGSTYSMGGSEHKTIPDECQLCRLLDYRGGEINEPSHSHQVAREDGGTKFVYACERCLKEMGWWGQERLREPLNPNS